MLNVFIHTLRLLYKHCGGQWIFFLILLLNIDFVYLLELHRRLLHVHGRILVTTVLYHKDTQIVYVKIIIMPYCQNIKP